MSTLPAETSHRKRRSYLAAMAALKQAWSRAVNRGLNKLTPQQAWELKCCFRKACAMADLAGAGVGDMASYLTGAHRFSIEAFLKIANGLCAADEYATPPLANDRKVIMLVTEVADRDRIRTFLREVRPAPPPLIGTVLVGAPRAPPVWVALFFLFQLNRRRSRYGNA